MRDVWTAVVCMFIGLVFTNLGTYCMAWQQAHLDAYQEGREFEQANTHLFKVEAVRKGYAEWKLDEYGKAAWSWKENPCEERSEQ